LHLCFEDNYDEKLKRRFSYSSHFSCKHQVAAYSIHIPLNLQLKGTVEEEKCLTILFSYLANAIQASEVVEYFTSLSGKEDLALSKKRNIHWLGIKKPYDLVLEDREFWGITY
jgi:hypothetical protein